MAVWGAGLDGQSLSLMGTDSQGGTAWAYHEGTPDGRSGEGLEWEMVARAMPRWSTRVI
jgi:hypothetical protein